MTQPFKNPNHPCLCHHKRADHLDNAEHPCMVILRYDGARSVCACTHYTPTRAKSPKIVLRQFIAK